MAALANHLGWSHACDDFCPACHKQISSRPPFMATFSLNTTARCDPEGHDIQQFLNDCTNCNLCHGLAAPNDSNDSGNGELSSEVQMINIIVACPPEGQRTNCEATLRALDLSVTVAGVEFDLVSFTWRTHDKMASKPRPYTCTLRFPPLQDASPWYHHVAKGQHEITSWRHLQSQSTLRQHVTSLLYMRRASTQHAHVTSKHPAVGELMLHNGRVTAVTHVVHRNAFRAQNCDKDDLVMTEDQVLRG